MPFTNLERGKQRCLILSSEFRQKSRCYGVAMVNGDDEHLVIFFDSESSVHNGRFPKLIKHETELSILKIILGNKNI